MEFLVNNWYILVAIVAVIAVAAVAIYAFIKQPKSKQIAKIKEWLLWAVAQAEKALGGGTGQLKLRYVYDMFVTRFPYMSRIITFEAFSLMVDQALEKFKKILEINTKVEAYVIGEKGE